MFLFFLLHTQVIAQNFKPNYSVSQIKASIKANADAVVRKHAVNCKIDSHEKMTIKTEWVVTVLNEDGLEYVVSKEHYNNKRKLHHVQLQKYDSTGKLVKTYRKGSFNDYGLFDGSTIESDTRIVGCELDSGVYPITYRFLSTVETSSTAFIPDFMPIRGYNVGLESADISFEVNPDLRFQFNPNQIGKDVISIVQRDNSFSFCTDDFSPITWEMMDEPFTNKVPLIDFSLEKFMLEGVTGTAQDWKSWGKWYYDSLLSDTGDLPVETKVKIQELTKHANSVEEKAAIVYDYVKSKVRYISIQVGIGGFKPMLAAEVDRLSYGDCKALTNYTKALLNAIDIPAYFTLVYGGKNKRSISKDFVSLQGNHAILAIPKENDYIWVECTSQDLPFGFAGAFTADRDALVIKDEAGGEIVHTKKFSTKDNTRTILAEVDVSNDGSARSNITVENSGLFFDSSYRIQYANNQQRDARYKKLFSQLLEPKFSNFGTSVNSNELKFIEKLSASSNGVIEQVSQHKIIQPLIFVESVIVPRRIKNRKSTFSVEEPSTVDAEISLNLDKSLAFDKMPDDVVLKSAFGNYHLSFRKLDEKTCLVKRTFVLEQGVYKSDLFEQYRLFLEQVRRMDQIKILLKN